MAQPITFRPDSEVERALAALTADGTTVSERALRAEAQALADDPRDRAEATSVLRDLETLRAW